MARIAISDKPVLLRIAAPRARAARVDREAKVIHGFSVITRGEALGHYLWIDQEFLSQVAAAGNARKAGLKSRFTHPGLSGDGMGKQIGRAKDFRLEGGQVYADLHLYEKANQEYVENVMDLAEEDPAAFGASIVFGEDVGAMDRFLADHEDKDGVFHSPDPDNAKNLPHARLADLLAVDAVDEPAANPDGLFSMEFLPGSELAARAEAFLAYAFGLTEQAPAELAGGPHPERARAFAQGFLERQGLTLFGVEALRAMQGKIANYEAVELRRKESILLALQQIQFEAEAGLR